LTVREGGETPLVLLPSSTYLVMVVKFLGQISHYTGLDRPLRSLSFPEFLDKSAHKVARLSANHTGRLYPPLPLRLDNTGRFKMYSHITKIYYRKTVRHVFTKPVQIERATKNLFPPSKLFFIVVHISAARRCQCM